MKSIIKSRIKQLFECFEYQISRKKPFTVQGQLISAKDPIIFDIGAHVGSVTKIYRSLFPRAFIYSFEPFPQSFQELLKNTEGDSRIFCHQKAASCKEGNAILNVNMYSATNSMLATDDRGSSFWGDGLLDTISRIQVNTTTVDLFCKETGISNIDILKMDVQGAEFSVLKGATDMLKNQQIALIYIELILCPTYKGQNKFHEYLSFLASFGYEMLDFYNPIRHYNQLIQADFIFLSSALRSRTKR